MAGCSHVSDRATALRTKKLPSIPEQGKEIFPFHLRRYQLSGPFSCPVGTGGYFIGEWALKWTGRMLAIIIHLLPRSRTRGAVPPPPYTSS